MKLISLEIENFKGIRSLKIEPAGNDFNIYGDNATGKTSIIDAFMWLLFEKDSSDRKDFNIKPLNSIGDVLNHGSETTVAAVILHNGEETEYCKTYFEKWTKKKGSSNPEFDGHSTEYYIDNLPVKKKDYDESVNTLCNKDIFKMLTNPLYFCQTISWQDRRKILFEICGGDISESSILESDSKFQPLLEGKGKHTVSDYKTICTSSRSKTNKELENIPIRISELHNQLEEVNINPDTEQEEINKLNDMLLPLESELQRILNGQQLHAKENRISFNKNALTELDHKNHEFQFSQREAYDKKLSEATAADREKLTELAVRETSLEKSISLAETKLFQLNDKRNSLLAAYREINSQEWDSSKEVCPTCKQSLPTNEIEEIRNRFHQEKSEALSRNVAEGKETAEKINSVTALLENEKSNLFIISKGIKDIQEKLGKASGKPFGLSNITGYEKDKKTILAEISDLESSLSDIRNNQNAEAEKVRLKIEPIKEQIKAHERNILIHEQQKGIQKRISELETTRLTLNEALEELDMLIFLCDEFIKAKVSAIEENINSKFDKARFKLFDVQINGGISEACEVTYNGVPFNDLNNAAKINTGIDVINSLTRHYGFDAPIFIDNAESVTSLYETPSQVIRLVVSETDKSLRCELA